MVHLKRLFETLCVGASLAVGLATLCTLAVRWWWPLELLTHFRVQYVWLLLPLLLGLLAWRRWWIAGLATGCLLWNVCLTAPVYLPASWPPAGEPNLRVMSVNVLTENRDHQQLISAVQLTDPDVLLVMEINHAWADRLQALRGRYPHGEVHPRADNFGIALYSKLPVTSLQMLTLGTAQVPTIHAQLTVGQQVVHFIGTHPLPPIRAGAGHHNSQLAAVASYAAELNGPVIVAGDLNITPWSPYFRDFLRVSGLRDSRQGHGNHATWPSELGPLGIPIDHVLVSPSIAVTRRAVLPAAGSDHRAVLVDVAVGD